MRRQLMKKMRKGSLTPSERTELRELDREVNRANRQAAGMGGAGLAAALAVASKTGALGEGMDALGEFLDARKSGGDDTAEGGAGFLANRRARKVGQEASEAQLETEAMRREELMDSLPMDSPDPSKREKKRRMKAADEAALLGLNIEQEEEDFVDEQLDADLRKYEMEKGPYGPTRDNAGFQEAQRVQAVREAMQDFRDSEPTEAEETAARRQRLLDERMMQGDPSNMEGIVGPGREQGFGDPRGIGAMPAGSGIPLTTDGPREEFAKGGYTPFLRSMRDRIRKKFR